MQGKGVREGEGEGKSLWRRLPVDEMRRGERGKRGKRIRG